MKAFPVLPLSRAPPTRCDYRRKEPETWLLAASGSPLTCQKNMHYFLTYETTVTSAPDRIVKRARSSGRGSVFTPNDFLDLAGRAAIGQAQSRLVKTGKFRRLARGLYDFPKVHPQLGPLSPAPDDIAQTLARETGSQVQVAGPRAANVLGLSTQVPARSSYLTDGPSRRVVLGKRIVDFRRASPKHLIAPGSAAGTVVQALRQSWAVAGSRCRSCRVAPAFAERQEEARLDGGSGTCLDACDAVRHCEHHLGRGQWISSLLLA